MIDGGEGWGGEGDNVVGGDDGGGGFTVDGETEDFEADTAEEFGTESSPSGPWPFLRPESPSFGIHRWVIFGMS